MHIKYAIYESRNISMDNKLGLTKRTQEKYPPKKSCRYSSRVLTIIAKSSTKLRVPESGKRGIQSTAASPSTKAACFLLRLPQKVRRLAVNVPDEYH